MYKNVLEKIVYWWNLKNKYSISLIAIYWHNFKTIKTKGITNKYWILIISNNVEQRTSMSDDDKL